MRLEIWDLKMEVGVGVGGDGWVEKSFLWGDMDIVWNYCAQCWIIWTSC